MAAGLHWTLRALALAALAAPAPSRADAFGCDAVNYCQGLPRDAAGRPAYNVADETRPFVIGGADLVSLGGRSWRPGPTAGPPTIYVVEDAALTAESLGTTEGYLGAQLILCDRAQLRVVDSTLRIGQDQDGQFPIYAHAQSAVTLSGAVIKAMSAGAEDKGISGYLAWHAQGSSTLTVSPRSGRPGLVMAEPLRLVAVQDAQVLIAGAQVPALLYPQMNAKVTLESSTIDAVVFESCGHLSLDGLPELCDADDPVAGCASGNLPAIAFATAPPKTTFTLSLRDARLTAWRVTALEGANVAIGNARPRANLTVALDFGGGSRAIALTAKQGAEPSVAGLPAQAVTFRSAHVRRLDVLPQDDTEVTLQQGSVVGDCVPPLRGSLQAEQTVLVGGSAIVRPGALLHLVGGSAVEPIVNNGALLCAGCDLRGLLQSTGGVWLADATLDHLRGDERFAGAKVHRAALSAPAARSTLAGPLAVRGTLEATGDDKKPLAPFPPAKLDLLQLETRKVIGLKTFLAPVTDQELATVDPSGLAPGRYHLRLYFDSAEGLRGASVRELDVPGRDAGSTDAALADAAGADAGGPAADDGCGCQAGAGALGALALLLGLPFALPRRRPAR